MIPIVFRGKRVDNGEFVYEDLSQFYIHHYKNGNSTIIEGGCVMHEVDPKTVGQFTGKRDKNEKEIYSGDVVAIFSGINKSQILRKGVVNYHNACRYIGENHVLDALGIFGNKQQIEVVGNIHEELIDQPLQ